MADKAVDNSKALVHAQPKPLAVVPPKPLAVVPPKRAAKVPQRYEQAYYMQEPSDPSPTRRLLQGITNGK